MVVISHLIHCFFIIVLFFAFILKKVVMSSMFVASWLQFGVSVTRYDFSWIIPTNRKSGKGILEELNEKANSR
jgi:hypothetical protein